MDGLDVIAVLDALNQARVRHRTGYPLRRQDHRDLAELDRLAAGGRKAEDGRKAGDAT